MFHRRVQKFLNFGKGNNLIEALSNFRFSHSQNRAVQKNILAPGKFRVKSRSDLKQTSKPPPQDHLALSRTGDARKNFQQRALTRTIPSDDPNHVSLTDIDAHILQRPEGVQLFFRNLPMIAPNERSQWRTDYPLHNFAEIVRPLDALSAQLIFLRNISNFEDRFHQSRDFLNNVRKTVFHTPEDEQPRNKKEHADSQRYS